VKTAIKWMGIVLGSLIGLVFIAGIVLFMVGNARLNKTYDFPSSNIIVPTDEASIEFGRHRVQTLCAGCHGEDLGGIVNWFNADGLGTIDSANLTAGEGGIAREYTSDEDYVGAIRHGIDPKGKPIFMNAVVSTAYLSNEDLGAIIAYLKTIPPVDRKSDRYHFTPMAKILFAAGLFPALPVETVSHQTQIAAPERGVSVEYGGYLVDTNDCRVCHGETLAGGPFPDPTIKLISPNLTPGGQVGFWSEEDFITAMRTGIKPGGYSFSEHMPWQVYKLFTDDELKAIYLYLQSLPKLEQFAG
jgi:mono/diheme cytochrome c family protein